LITRALAKGEDGRRNKFLLPSRLRLDERSSSTTRALAKGEDERSSSTTRALAKSKELKFFLTRPNELVGEDGPLGSLPTFSSIMDRKYAEYLLEKTKENYNLTAEEYTRTRAFIPEDIKSLSDYIKEGDKILDSGCASGRLFGVLREKKVDYSGVDVSERLIEIAKKNYPEGNFQITNALNLPFTDNFFDKIYSISVIHNIPSKDFQLRYLLESKRVLKPGGLLILRVWDFWKRKEGWKLFLKYSSLKLMGKSKMDFYDVFIPWKNSNGEILVQRYFHCFTKREIEGLIRKTGLKVKKSWRGGKDPRTNIYIVAEKPI